VSSADDDGKVVDEGEAESSDLDDETLIQTKSRGKSRPALFGTGKPSTPR